MNGVHDMGGMHGMGPVEIEKNEPVFHSDWEARVHALNIACSSHRKWNIDVGRHSRERIPPAEYLAATYYEKWLRGLEMLLVEQGLVTAKELQTGRAESKASGVSALRVPEVATFLRDRDHGVFIFPDTHAMTRDKKPQHCYSVRFAARELWGSSAPARDSVYLDLWDDQDRKSTRLNSSHSQIS